VVKLQKVSIQIALALNFRSNDKSNLQASSCGRFHLTGSEQLTLYKPLTPQLLENSAREAWVALD
jgi:hypothetical protein